MKKQENTNQNKQKEVGLCKINEKTSKTFLMLELADQSKIKPFTENDVLEGLGLTEIKNEI